MLDKAELFVELVRAGTLSEAGASKNISTPTASRWIKQLEEEINTKLIVRGTQLLTLTPSGQAFYDRFSKIIDDSNQAVFELNNHQLNESGHINIMSSPIYTNHFLLDKVGSFMKLYPSVSVKVEISPWGMNTEGNYDIVILASSASSHAYEKTMKSYVRRELIRCPFRLVASKEYMSKSRQITELSDIQFHKCIFASSLTGNNEWIFSKNGEQVVQNVPKTLEVNDAQLLLKSTLNGIGISYLPSMLCDKYIEHGALVHLLPQYETVDWSLAMYYRPKSNSTPVAHSLQQFLLNNNDAYIKKVSRLFG